jgi:hypothetical protein
VLPAAFRLKIVVACGVEADVTQSRYLDAAALAPTGLVDADVASRNDTWHCGFALAR